MRIYLLRHAKSEPGYPDAARVLAARGRAHTAALGSFFRGQDRFRPQELWCSPLTRAEETADRFLQAWGGPVHDRRSVDALEPERDPGVLVEELVSLGREVLLVGHNPNIEILASLLISGERSRAQILIQTGVMLCLERSDYPNYGQTGPCALRWMLDPRLLSEPVGSV
ncbi:MAG: SixA phosphatase family protein [Coraliomargarita sp.]